MSDENIAWVDCETTGLIAHEEHLDARFVKNLCRVLVVGGEHGELRPGALGGVQVVRANFRSVGREPGCRRGAVGRGKLGGDAFAIGRGQRGRRDSRGVCGCHGTSLLRLQDVAGWGMVCHRCRAVLSRVGTAGS